MTVLDKTAGIKFGEPRQHDISIERCIRERRSVRAFRDRALTKDELGQLLWAAQGVTAADGKRAVASSGALYPLELYAACVDACGKPALITDSTESASPDFVSENGAPFKAGEPEDLGGATRTDHLCDEEWPYSRPRVASAISNRWDLLVGARQQGALA